MATDVYGEISGGCFGEVHFYGKYSGGAASRQDGSSFPYSRRQLRKCRSSAMLPYCRRVYANSVTLLVFPAEFSHAKFANRRRIPALPPSISVTILPNSPTKKTGFPAFFGNSTFCIG
jgi:hypothetical protein